MVNFTRSSVLFVDRTNLGGKNNGPGRRWQGVDPGQYDRLFQPPEPVFRCFQLCAEFLPRQAG